jgi:hypothetical protein
MSSVPNNQRYARQIILDEVGEAGQERLASARPDVSGLRPEVASTAQRYARACGLGVSAATSPVVCQPAEDVVRFFRHDASAAVGLGASATLSVALSVLLPSTQRS